MANEKLLIDVNDALKTVCDHCCYDFKMCQQDGFCADYMNIKRLPTVDAVPVVHGRWIHIVEDGKGGCYGFCSRCSTEHHADSTSALKAFHRHCRWCGAKMDGDGNA